MTRSYAARHGQQEMRACDACGRVEVALSAERPRDHHPAHAVHRAAAA